MTLFPASIDDHYPTLNAAESYSAPYLSCLFLGNRRLEYAATCVFLAMVRRASPLTGCISPHRSQVLIVFQSVFRGLKEYEETTHKEPLQAVGRKLEMGWV